MNERIIRLQNRLIKISASVSSNNNNILTTLLLLGYNQ